jgi:hypothetical protein
MAKLSPAQKERIKFHLGINDNTPSGDVYWADIQLAKIYQDQTIHLLKANLDGLDETYLLMTATTAIVRQEAIIGDVNRTITNTEVDPAKVRKRYVAQGDLLAETLGLVNRRGKDAGQRSGESGVVPYLSRPDGSSVGSRLMMADSWS